jgi:hypothetical protein
MEQITATFLPQFLPNAELLQFLPTSKLALNGKPQIYFRIPPKYTCRGAAKNGHLEVLKWLRSQDPPCPWDKWTCTWAAKNGDLEVLKWLRSRRVEKPPWMVIWRC